MGDREDVSIVPFSVYPTPAKMPRRRALVVGASLPL